MLDWVGVWRAAELVGAKENPSAILLAETWS